jgi:hypothetical protein
VAIEVKETADSDLVKPFDLEAIGLTKEKEKKEERKEEKRSRAGPGTIIYPDRVPATATTAVPASSVAAAGSRSLVIITGKVRARRENALCTVYGLKSWTQRKRSVVRTLAVAYADLTVLPPQTHPCKRLIMYPPYTYH